MKKRIAIFIFTILLASLNLAAQQRVNRFATLDRYFAGLPLQSGYEQWYQYVTTHPYLGIDSTTRRGNHTSLKPGIESHFPFPDLQNVTLTFQKIIYTDPRTRKFIDTLKRVEIQGLFGKGKTARKEANKFFKGLRRDLMRNYRYEYRDYYNEESWFYRGKTNSFPYCSLHFGYSDRLKSYYVSLAYDDQKSPVIKKYNPPFRSTRRY